MQPFRKFLAVLPSPTLYKVETRKKFWIHASNIVCGVRGGVYCIVVLTYLADDQHLSNCFAAHVCSCDDVVLLTRIPSSYCFSRCQGYIFGASYKLFRCGITNRHGGILNYLKTEPGEKALLHFLNQFWNVKRLILFCSDCNGSQKLDGFAWEKKNFCHQVTAKLCSIQILVNFEIFKLS